MEDWAWQFIPKYHPTQTPGDDNLEIELLELDWEEILSLTLFAIDKLSSQSGLPAPELYHRDTTEEEEDALVQSVKEFQESRRLHAGSPVI